MIQYSIQYSNVINFYGESEFLYCKILKLLGNSKMSSLSNNNNVEFIRWYLE